MLCRTVARTRTGLVKTGIHVASRQPSRRAGSAKIEVKEDEYPTLKENEDPEMNGRYVNPPRVKRQFRDPHADWWDKQERRNFGEPVHEDNDILGMLSPYEYTHVKPKTALLQICCFIGAVLGLTGIVHLNYPDRPSIAKGYEGGLELELGGPGAVRAKVLEE